jgi:hypothetical protein
MRSDSSPISEKVSFGDGKSSLMQAIAFGDIKLMASAAAGITTQPGFPPDGRSIFKV